MTSKTTNKFSPELREIRVLQVGVYRHQAARQVRLHHRQQLAKQHGKPALASQTNHLSPGLALLQPERRWHDLIGEPTLADAILDRIIHNAHRLQLSGDSLRKQNPPKITDA